MKKLNNFLKKAPLWQFFIFGWIFTGAFTFLLFQYSDVLIGGTSSPTIVNLKIGASLGLMFGLMFMLMFSMSRKSDKFWDYAKVVEELINKAETKESLQLIFDNEFQDLQKLQMGHPHGYKLKELYTILKTKYQYLNKQDTKKETLEEATETHAFNFYEKEDRVIVVGSGMPPPKLTLELTQKEARGLLNCIMRTHAKGTDLDIGEAIEEKLWEFLKPLEKK